MSTVSFFKAVDKHGWNYFKNIPNAYTVVQEEHKKNSFPMNAVTEVRRLVPIEQVTTKFPREKFGVHWHGTGLSRVVEQIQKGYIENQGEKLYISINDFEKGMTLAYAQTRAHANDKPIILEVAVPHEHSITIPRVPLKTFAYGVDIPIIAAYEINEDWQKIKAQESSLSALAIKAKELVAKVHREVCKSCEKE